MHAGCDTSCALTIRQTTPCLHHQNCRCPSAQNQGIRASCRIQLPTVGLKFHCIHAPPGLFCLSAVKVILLRTIACRQAPCRRGACGPEILWNRQRHSHRYSASPKKSINPQEPAETDCKPTARNRNPMKPRAPSQNTRVRNVISRPLNIEARFERKPKNRPRVGPTSVSPHANHPWPTRCPVANHGP